MRRRQRLYVALAAVLACAWTGQAEAQVIQPPPRGSRALFGGGPPPDPTRTRQELTFLGNVLGGFDDNLSSPVPGTEFLSNPSGYVGFADAGMRYFVGRDVRSFEVVGRGYANSYGNVGIGTDYGADGTLRGRTLLGRRTQFDITEGVRYSPYFSLGVFGGLNGGPDLSTPDTNVTNALTKSRSLATDTVASLTSQWTRRTRTDANFTFQKQTYSEGIGFDTQGWTTTLGFQQSFGGAASLRTSYRHSDEEFAQPGGGVPSLKDDTVDLGFAYQRRLSATRQLSVSGGGGSVYVQNPQFGNSLPLNYWTPTAYGSARVDVGRSWAVWGDYRRSVSVLQGATPVPFVTHVALMSTGGYVGRVLETVFSVGYSNGQTGQSADASAIGQYDSYTGTAQLRVRLGRLWSSVVSYNHNEYFLNSVASVALRVAPEMHRNSVRAGLVFALPLVGNYLTNPGPPGVGGN